MATISVGPRNYIRPYRNVRVRQFPVAASQTIRVGDPLQLNTTADKGNEVKLSVADPTTDRGLVGFAAEAITTGASPSAVTDRIIVWLADEDAEFLAHVADTQVLDNDDISVRYGVVADGTNNIWRVDRTEVTAIIFKVLELIDVHGDVNGRVVVQVLSPERLYGD